MPLPDSGRPSGDGQKEEPLERRQDRRADQRNRDRTVRSTDRKPQSRAGDAPSTPRIPAGLPASRAERSIYDKTRGRGPAPEVLGALLFLFLTDDTMRCPGDHVKTFFPMLLPQSSHSPYSGVSRRFMASSIFPRRSLSALERLIRNSLV